MVSIPLPQLQIRFKQSQKPCLNLWLRRRLKPSLSLAYNCIPNLLLKYKKIADDRRDLKMFFLNCNNFRFVHVWIYETPFNCSRMEKKIV